MTASQIVTIGNAALTAGISTKGAELQSLVPAWGGDVIWQADPAVWPWHAPNLFPIVGALTNDTLVHQGASYAMKSHGFLRHSLTTLVARTDDAASFRLTDTAETRQQYPFAFELTISFRIDGDRLIQTFSVNNPATETLLVSLGGHPAFRWPLSETMDRAAHRLVFACAEPQGIRRVVNNGLSLESFPTPVAGRVLALDDALFDIGAMVWDHLNSKELTFGVPGQQGIEMTFDDFPHFGVWTKPGGARFLCLEPWQGHMSPLGFHGEQADKPGIASIAPGASRQWSLSIRPVEHLSMNP
ncbi:aldose 1-epimerase family protein [Telmatospirillum sp.]|uniref:aldose 1-epimerase family protein n=1 Tax=Telmatospirillum sp. TaxID=2079197 RepID=UPI002845A846|nr:aldose 1-epimerase family protein [Telmatospirillum sp.]MDR3435145.1 aldose 1-epimerase family protein [Telmatospirillum sp.]